jgi:hypothetical protein
MKTIALAVVMPSLILSAWALAAQETEQKKDPSMMEHMMKEGEGEKSRRGMMRMMKMIDQCATMMESSHGSEESKGNSKK